LAVLEDITKSKQAEQELRRSKKLLAETELIGRVGGWEVDINTRMITWTDELYRIHEVDTSFKPNVNTGISFYTPESQPVIEKAVERAIEFGEPFDLELEIITAKGNLRSVHSIGKTDPENNRIYGFFQDITERKRIEIAIQQLNSELEQRVLERTHQLEMANKELEAFSYSVSHDLRAPLRHINGYVDLLTAKFSDHLPEKATYYLSVITDSTREMGILIDDLLRFSRTSRQDLHKINFDMNILVNEVVDKVKEDEPLRRIVWSVQNLPQVFGDVAMLKQVWTNLISRPLKSI
jgi:signal transduction histidine kinase